MKLEIKSDEELERDIASFFKRQESMMSERMPLKKGVLLEMPTHPAKWSVAFHLLRSVLRNQH